MYHPRDALFLDNGRDFTQMGQTAFKPLILFMLLVIIICFKHLLTISFRPYDAVFVFFSFSIIKQSLIKKNK